MWIQINQKFSKVTIFWRKIITEICQKLNTFGNIYNDLKKETFQHFLITALSFSCKYSFDIIKGEKMTKINLFSRLKIIKGLTLNNHYFILWNISAVSHVMFFWKKKSKRTNLHKTQKCKTSSDLSGKWINSTGYHPLDDTHTKFGVLAIFQKG